MKLGLVARLAVGMGIGMAALLCGGPLSAQKYTDPDTLAPAFPSPESVVDRMLELSDVKPGEVVYDLGCGDGRIVIAAARKFKAKAVGVEIRRDIFEATQARIVSLGLTDQVRIIHGNALRTDLRDADVVTLYLMTGANERLRPNLEKYLRPTSRVVSHDFEIKGWKPVKVEKVTTGGIGHTIYVYRMNAK